MGEALPDELMDTLQHVQIACLEEKKRRAQAAVATALVVAAGEGAAPIPFEYVFRRTTEPSGDGGVTISVRYVRILDLRQDLESK